MTNDDNFLEEIGAAELLGTIGGLLGRHPIALDVKPVLTPKAHMMRAVRVTTEHGVFEVEVKIV